MVISIQAQNEAHFDSLTLTLQMFIQIDSLESLELRDVLEIKGDDFVSVTGIALSSTGELSVAGGAYDAIRFSKHDEVIESEGSPHAYAWLISIAEEGTLGTPHLSEEVMEIS